jgi:hypothetical protein
MATKRSKKAADPTKAFSLTIIGAAEDIPRGFYGSGKDCTGAGSYSVALSPTKLKSATVWEDKAGVNFKLAENTKASDSPKEPSKDVTPRQAVGALKKVINAIPKRAGNIVYKGRWVGRVECTDKGPQIILTRNIASYATLAIVSHLDGKWEYAVIVKEGSTWYTGKKEHQKGNFSSFRACYDKAMGKLLALVGAACTIQHTHRGPRTARASDAYREAEAAKIERMHSRSSSRRSRVTGAVTGRDAPPTKVANTYGKNRIIKDEGHKWHGWAGKVTRIANIKGVWRLSLSRTVKGKKRTHTALYEETRGIKKLPPLKAAAPKKDKPSKPTATAAPSAKIPADIEKLIGTKRTIKIKQEDGSYKKSTRKVMDAELRGKTWKLVFGKGKSRILRAVGSTSEPGGKTGTAPKPRPQPSTSTSTDEKPPKSIEKWVGKTVYFKAKNAKNKMTTRKRKVTGGTKMMGKWYLVLGTGKSAIKKLPDSVALTAADLAAPPKPSTSTTTAPAADDKKKPRKPKFATADEMPANVAALVGSKMSYKVKGKVKTGKVWGAKLLKSGWGVYFKVGGAYKRVAVAKVFAPGTAPVKPQRPTAQATASVATLPMGGDTEELTPEALMAQLQAIG